MSDSPRPLGAIADRYRGYAPATYLTLMSLIQAIAVERLVDEVQAAGGVLVAADWGSAVVLLQAALLLSVILLSWVSTVQGFMMLPWVSNIDDPILPIAIGIFQFSTISLIGLDHLVVWSFLMSALGLVAFNHYKRLFGELREEAEVQAYRKLLSAKAVYGGLAGYSLMLALAAVLSLFEVGDLRVTAMLMVSSEICLIGVLAAWLLAWKRVMATG